jgi:hypothetical protein
LTVQSFHESGVPVSGRVGDGEFRQTGEERFGRPAAPFRAFPPQDFPDVDGRGRKLITSVNRILDEANGGWLPAQELDKDVRIEE